MAKSKPLAIAAVLLVSLSSVLVARAATTSSAPVDQGPPPGAVPTRVAACLALPAGEQRANCFRNLAPSATVPPRVAACLALPTRTQRTNCFRNLVPPKVAGCLALQTQTQRSGCLKKLRRP